LDIKLNRMNINKLPTINSAYMSPKCILPDRSNMKPKRNAIIKGPDKSVY